MALLRPGLCVSIQQQSYKKTSSLKKDVVGRNDKISVGAQANGKCIARFRLKLGTKVEPNRCWEAAYFQVHLFAQAMYKSDSDAIDQLLPSLLGSEFNAPQGQVRINPINHHTRLNPRIARISHADKFEIVQEISAGVDADPYLLKHEHSDLQEFQQSVIDYDA